jgi:hypothetical protein
VKIQRLLLVVLLLMIGFSSAFAQRRGQRRTPRSIDHRLELSVLAGYQFGGSLDGRDGEYSLDDALSVTAIADVTLRPGAQFEFMYSRQFTQEQFQPYVGGVKETLWDATVEYFQFGGLGYVDAGAAQTFAVGTLGWTTYKVDDPTVSGESKFSATLGLGARAFPNDRIGVRVEVRMLMTFMETTGALGCGGWGCTGGFYGWGILQGVLSGGLTVGI